MGKLAGFTLLFEALILTLCWEMPFAAVARRVNLSWHRVAAICERYVVPPAVDWTLICSSCGLPAVERAARYTESITGCRQAVLVEEAQDFKAFLGILGAYPKDAPARPQEGHASTRAAHRTAPAV